MKKWNATRWLGRFTSLEALCKAYPYVLDHLRAEMSKPSNKAKVRQAVTELYKALTNYDNFLFFFFYRDLLKILATKSKQFQARDLEISDVGRLIKQLIDRLDLAFPKDSLLPDDLRGDGESDNLMRELFGNDLAHNAYFSIID